MSGSDTGARGAPTIVIADDDEEMRRVLADAFRGEGYATREVSDGSALAAYIETGRLDDEEVAAELILSDIRMPGCSGLEALALLRARDWEIRVVLMTAFGDPHTHREAARLGANATLDKPFELEEILAIVRRMLPIGPG